MKYHQTIIRHFVPKGLTFQWCKKLIRSVLKDWAVKWSNYPPLSSFSMSEPTMSKNRNLFSSDQKYGCLQKGWLIYSKGICSIGIGEFWVPFPISMKVDKVTLCHVTWQLLYWPRLLQHKKGHKKLFTLDECCRKLKCGTFVTLIRS